MKLNKIDLKNVIAAGHNQEDLVLLIDRGNEIEYLEISAPQAAYEGLQQVADYANPPCPPQLKHQSQTELRPKPIPLFANESGIFNRVENRTESQSSLTVESAQSTEDEPSQTWEMLGNVNFS
ncbi:MAG: KTSC domain-containing protein [Microcoleaceae cyanobacterium]